VNAGDDSSGDVKCTSLGSSVLAFNMGTGDEGRGIDAGFSAAKSSIGVSGLILNNLQTVRKKTG
jgi:hypothetical protein